MTGYGRGESERNDSRIRVEINSVNRRQSDIVINLPRELSAFEPRVRQVVNERVTRGRTNVVVAFERSANATPSLALDRALARSYHESMRALQEELRVKGTDADEAMLFRGVVTEDGTEYRDMYADSRTQVTEHVG